MSAFELAFLFAVAVGVAGVVCGVSFDQLLVGTSFAGLGAFLGAKLS